MGQIRNLATGPSAQTLATSIAGQALTLISGVIAARALGVEGRGLFAYLWLIPVTLVLLGGIGVPQATTFYVAREEGNAAGVVRISVRISLVLAALLTTAYAVGLFLIGGDDPRITTVEAILSVLLVPVFLASNLGIAALLGMKRYGTFNIARVAPPFFYALGATILFLLGHVSLLTILSASVLSFGTSAIVIWILVRRDLPSSGGETAATPREIIGFGLRGVVGSVSPVDDVRIDQLLVGALMNARALGLYVAAVAFCNLPRFIAYAIGSVSFPRIASAGSRAEAWALARKALRIFLALATVTVVSLFLLLPYLLPLLFGNDFKEAVGLGQILLIAAFFLALHRLLTELARGLGHPGYGSITEIVNVAVFALAVLILATPATTNGIAESVVAGGIASSSLLLFLLFRLRLKQRDL
ncbi:MAG: oligosaccharide flippase family protein [Solirubrobacterales bacterium]